MMKKKLKEGERFRMRARRTPLFRPGQIVSLYESGKTEKEISIEIGCSLSTVKKAIAKSTTRKKKLTDWDIGFMNAVLVSARLDGMGSAGAAELARNGGYSESDFVRSKAFTTIEIRFIFNDEQED